MKQTELQPFYILHTRAYRDTSLLVDCLTRQEGYITVVAKGAKRPKSSMKYNLHPFVLLEGSWIGRGELATLVTAELTSMRKTHLVGDALFRALYVNELLTKLLHRHDPCAGIFDAYHDLLSSDFLETDLRCFEKKLLSELGYGLNLEFDSQTHDPILKEEKYYFYPQSGCVKVSGDMFSQNDESIIFDGASLLDIANDRYHSQSVLRDAKRLMRLAFQPLLSGRVLKSREFYQRLE